MAPCCHLDAVSLPSGCSVWAFRGREGSGRGGEVETGEGWVLIDIGGGRGDLAVNLARLLPRYAHEPAAQP